VHFPLDLRFGNLSVSAHFILETLAFVIGFRYFLFLKRRKSDPISENNRVWIIIAATFGAFLFSRVLGSLEDPSGWISSNNFWLYFYSSKTIVGGLLGGLICVEVAKFFLNESSSSGDLFTYPLILAMIIGRIGCFTSGITEPTYGVASSLPWAIDLGDGVQRHPVTLYEILFLAALWIILFQIEKGGSFAMGIRFKLFMISYLSFRFALEFIKPTHDILFSLSSIQIACLLGLLYYYRTITFILYNPSNLLTHER
jgi:phosphatidylglycerol---prolipoprotein diacylglyceryl transferase